MSNIQRLEEGILIIPAEPGWKVCQVVGGGFTKEPLDVVEDPIIAWAVVNRTTGINVHPVVPFHGMIEYYEGMLLRSPDGKYFDNKTEVTDFQRVAEENQHRARREFEKRRDRARTEF